VANRITLAGVKDVLLAIIAAGGVLTLGTGALSEYGWVTKKTYTEDAENYVQASVYRSHTASVDSNFAAQSKVNSEISGSLNEIKALLTIVPQLKALIRNRCDGGRGLDRTIDDLKERYRMLTGTEYDEPACSSPELLE
jgi:hypothetical protein